MSPLLRPSGPPLSLAPPLPHVSPLPLPHVPLLMLLFPMLLSSVIYSASRQRSTSSRNSMFWGLARHLAKGLWHTLVAMNLYHHAHVWAHQHYNLVF